MLLRTLATACLVTITASAASSRWSGASLSHKWGPSQVNRTDYPKWEYLSRLTWEPLAANVTKREETEDNTPKSYISAKASSAPVKASSPASAVGVAKPATAPTAPPSLCLGATLATNGAPVALVDCASPEANVVIDSNYHIAFSAAGGRCLHVVNGTTAAVGDGHAVGVWDCHHTNVNQLWAWNNKNITGGWSLAWKATTGAGNAGLCVDVKDGNYSLGAEVQLWNCNRGENQVFGWKQLLGIRYLNPDVGIEDIIISY